MKLNTERSTEIAKIIKAKKGQCYINAFRTASLIGSEAKYVEGFAIIESVGVPLEHGWVEVGEEIIDPTWAPGTQSKIGYAPMVKFSMTELLPLLDKHGTELPIVWKLRKITAREVVQIVNDCIQALAEEN